MKLDGRPIQVQKAYNSAAPDSKIQQAANLISGAKAPVILAGNGVIRQGAAEELRRFAEVLRIPVANTFMNTCIISNAFASMGIAVPGAIAAKLAYPDRKHGACSPRRAWKK